MHPSLKFRIINVQTRRTRIPKLPEQLIPDYFYTIFREERMFPALIGFFFFVAGVAFPNTEVAMWVGFALAGYSAIANDSIQTIGTFIASNEDKKWWILWLFISLLAGREIAMSFTDARGKGKPLKRSFTLIGKDVGYALIGLAVSIALAIAINPEIDDEIFRHFFG